MKAELKCIKACWSLFGGQWTHLVKGFWVKIVLKISPAGSWVLRLTRGFFRSGPAWSDGWGHSSARPHALWWDELVFVFGFGPKWLNVFSSVCRWRQSSGEVSSKSEREDLKPACCFSWDGHCWTTGLSLCPSVSLPYPLVFCLPVCPSEDKPVRKLRFKGRLGRLFAVLVTGGVFIIFTQISVTTKNNSFTFYLCTAAWAHHGSFSSSGHI